MIEVLTSHLVDLQAMPLLPLAYLLGSIPFGLILAKLFGFGDLRQIGSGNTGATNALRTGSKTLAILTLLFDMLKGSILIICLFVIPKIVFSDSFLDVILDAPNVPEYVDLNGQIVNTNTRLSDPYKSALLFGLFAILGHCFPIWLKFKGGKGVATALGALLAAVPYAGLAAAGAWIATAFLFKISSLAALVAVGVAPIVTYFVYGAAPATVCFLITLLVWFRHKDNIKRLIAGTEPKIGAK